MCLVLMSGYLLVNLSTLDAAKQKMYLSCSWSHTISAANIKYHKRCKISSGLWVIYYQAAQT